jgi:hypothetical protein
MGIQGKMERLRVLKVETDALFGSISEGVRKAGWRGGKEHLKIMGWIDRLAFAWSMGRVQRMAAPCTVASYEAIKSRLDTASVDSQAAMKRAVDALKSK